MAHPRARLNVFGRELLVTRVLAQGWPVATAAEARASAGRPATSGCAAIRAEGSPAWPTAAPGRIARRARRQPAEVERILAARRRVALGTRSPGAAPRAIRPRRSAPSCAGAACRAWPTSTGRPACPSGATRSATRAPSSTRTTRSWAGSPTAAATGSSAARPRPRRRRRGLGYDHFEVIVDDRSRRARRGAGARRERGQRRGGARDALADVRRRRASRSSGS